jgi:HD-GYP domain-containing protein (c-di-GMP phosphodiesterase class II)
MSIDTDLRQVIYALSDAIDLCGVDAPNHGKRLATIVRECAAAAGFEGPVLDRAFEAALLHDCGVSRLVARCGKKRDAAGVWLGARDHCLVGHDLLLDVPPLAHLAPIVLHHHTPWDALTSVDVPEEAALLANLVLLADRVDALATPHLGAGLLLVTDGIRSIIHGLRGAYFAPAVVDAFESVSSRAAFWFALEDRYLVPTLAELGAEARPARVSFADLRRIAELFTHVVSAKSPFTAEHCLGVGRVARRLGKVLGRPDDVIEKLEVAGMLHDLGKLRVPSGILQKSSALTEADRAIVTRHSFETWQILRRIPGIDDIVDWAAHHHETPTGTGYPFRRSGAELGLDARIIAVADVLHALSQRRPYREPLLPDAIARGLRDGAASGELDPDVVEVACGDLGECWTAALGEVAAA